VTRLRLFARARDEAGRAVDTFDAPTLGALLDEASARYGAGFAGVLARSRVWVNGEEPTDGPSTVLAADDEVAILPPVSGGGVEGSAVGESGSSGSW